MKRAWTGRDQLSVQTVCLRVGVEGWGMYCGKRRSRDHAACRSHRALGGDVICLSA